MKLTNKTDKNDCAGERRPPRSPAARGVRQPAPQPSALLRPVRRRRRRRRRRPGRRLVRRLVPAAGLEFHKKCIEYTVLLWFTWSGFRLIFDVSLFVKSFHASSILLTTRLATPYSRLRNGFARHVSCLRSPWRNFLLK